MSKLEDAARTYICQELEKRDYHNFHGNGPVEESFIAGANWQIVETSKVIERAIIKHNHSTQETVLKNFRNICGSLNKGKCVIDGKKCAFNNCEALKDLFKE